MATVLLAGFVFGNAWVIPGLAAILGAAALLGRSGNLLYFIFDTAIAPRLDAPGTLDDQGTERFSTLLAVAVLVVATALLAVGLGGAAWALAVALAVTEAVAAVAGIPLGRAIYTRITGRRR